VVLCFSCTLDHLVKVLVHCPKVRVQLTHWRGRLVNLEFLVWKGGSRAATDCITVCCQWIVAFRVLQGLQICNRLWRGHHHASGLAQVVDLCRRVLLMHDFLLWHFAVTRYVSILGLFLIVPLGFLPFDLSLLKYLCDGLSLLLPLWTDDSLLLLPDREISCNHHVLRCGIQHRLPSTPSPFLVNLKLLSYYLIGIILLRGWGQGLLPGVVSWSHTHVERVHTSSLDIYMLQIHVIDKRDYLLYILSFLKWPVFKWQSNFLGFNSPSLIEELFLNLINNYTALRQLRLLCLICYCFLESNFWWILYQEFKWSRTVIRI
jgi:hypothetical protein